MKIIISHDIDHVNFTEHYKSLIVPKYIARGGLELIKGRIGVLELLKRLVNIFKIRFNRLEELTSFNKKHDVKETYFIGVNNGLGLVYSHKKVKILSQFLSGKKLVHGVHGIDFDDFKKIKKEYVDFETITKKTNFGIRMHYLRKDDTTLKGLSKAGYLFDATDMGLKNPYKVGEMWEFPIQIMDSYLMCEKKPYQTRSLDEVKEITLSKLKEAENLGLEYFSILFHDIYFDNGFKTWKDWYVWVIQYLKENNYEFINFESAIKELNNITK